MRRPVSGWCGRQTRWAEGQDSPTRPEGARWRRQQFRFWYFLVLMWLAYAVAQAVAALSRWIAGPLALAQGGALQIPIILIILACVILAVGFLARNVGSPLGDVVTASERVATGDLSVRVREQGAPWMRSVARAFNSMTSSLEVQHRQRRELMADVAHELRTPLAAMQGRLEGMLDGVYTTDRAHVSQVLDDARMLGRLVEDLRTLAHADSGTLALQREPTDVGVVAAEAAALSRAAADARGVRIATTIAAGLPLLDVDPLRVREVMANLVGNAVRHSPPGGVVTIDVKTNDGVVVASVSDQGPGIAADDLPRIFDRFYKGAGSNGSGLGLTIARNLAEAHGGTVSASNRLGGGTTLTLTLPVRD